MVTREELLNELVREFLGPPIPPNAFTARMFMNETGQSYGCCRHYLNELVRLGIIASIKTRSNIRWYFDVDKKPKQTVTRGKGERKDEHYA
jgi:hypothetical protein